MPKKSETRRIARSTRKSVKPGNRQAITGRQAGRRSEKSSPDFLANSISALRLTTIPGAKSLAFQSNIEGFDLLIRDISKCVKKLYPKVKLKASAGLPNYDEIDWWLQKLREVLPAGAKFNIDGDGDGFWIDIYRELDWSEWTIFEIYCDDILHYLRQTDLPGYELFIRFLNQIAHVIKCDTWSIGLFAESIDYFEEMLEYDRSALDPDDLEKANEEVLYFQKGEGAELGRQIHRVPPPGISYLIKQSSRIKDPFIRELVRYGCEIMRPGYGMTDFVDVVGYSEDEYSEMGLRFDSQVCLLLTSPSDSPAHYEYEQRIEVYSHEGGFSPPFNQVRIKPADRKPPDFAEFEKRGQWLMELNHFFLSWVSLATFYYDERIEQQIEVTV